jgi:hypothetical protein
MYAILEELNAGERRQISEANQRYITQINTGLNEAQTTEEKVKLLSNVTGRFFVMRRDWLMANPHNLETVEPIITARWNEIKATVTPELRKSMLDRCLIGADKATVDGFYVYSNKILPL